MYFAGFELGWDFFNWHSTWIGNTWQSSRGCRNRCTYVSFSGMVARGASHGDRTCPSVGIFCSVPCLEGTDRAGSPDQTLEGGKESSLDYGFVEF